MYPSKIFYTEFARLYAKYASTRSAYLLAVNKLVIQESKEFVNLIDIGSGDGIRSRKIADSINASNLALVDNSPGMIFLLESIKRAFVIPGDISDEKFKIGDKFDMATCLWNVFGHIPTAEKRKIALKNIKDLIVQDGIIFIDVNNRYNVCEYGFKNVIRNICKDIISPKEINGDFKLRIKVNGKTIKTKVHIFSPFEMNSLIKSSGLNIIQRHIIDYKTGRECKSIFGGQLVYKLSKI